jgi:hypothetical protein
MQNVLTANGLRRNDDAMKKCSRYYKNLKQPLKF